MSIIQCAELGSWNVTSCISNQGLSEGFLYYRAFSDTYLQKAGTSSFSGLFLDVRDWNEYHDAFFLIHLALLPFWV